MTVPHTSAQQTRTGCEIWPENCYFPPTFFICGCKLEGHQLKLLMPPKKEMGNHFKVQATPISSSLHSVDFLLQIRKFGTDFSASSSFFSSLHLLELYFSFSRPLSSLPPGRKSLTTICLAVMNSEPFRTNHLGQINETLQGDQLCVCVCACASEMLHNPRHHSVYAAVTDSV